MGNIKREIKFRAWASDDEKLYSWDELLEYTATDIFDTDPETEWGGTLMQFTGLKDKNGKEIYEGDIVRLSERIGEVLYHDRRAMFIIHDKDNFNEPLYQFIVEVIGNIYENPELLNQ